jgi:predicted NUDIX family NTP pyrophosphohydrolase
MPKQSAGILLYRPRSGAPEVLLVHPGGRFWARKDRGAWSISKGEHDDCDDPRAAALRGRIADRARKLNEVERVRERPSCMALKW